MKKVILVLLITIILILQTRIVFAANTLDQYYGTEHKDSWSFINNTTALNYNKRDAQTFQPTVSANLIKWQWYLSKSGTITSGTVHTEIWTNNNGQLGTKLGQSDNVNISSIPTVFDSTPFALFDFNFTSGVSLTADTTYIAVIVDDRAIGPSEWVYPAIQEQTTPSYSRGVGLEESYQDNFTTYGIDFDYIFYEYYDDTTTGTPTPTPTPPPYDTLSPASSDDLSTFSLTQELHIDNPSGSPTNGHKLIIRLKSDSSVHDLVFGNTYRGGDLTLPSSTTASKTLYLEFIYNSADSKWDLIRKVGGL